MATVTVTKSGPNVNVPGQTIEVSVPQHTSPPASAHSLPSAQSIALIACLSAVIAWGVVQAFKQGVTGYRKAKKKPGSPWWLSSALRAMSIIIGALAGWLLFDPMGATGVDYWGLAIGGSGGALATIIVQQIKSRIKGK